MTLLSLASVLAESARRAPDRLAVVQGDLRVGYGDLWRQARQHAAALQEQGVGPGDRVALLAPNVADFVRAYYGILAAGAVVVPVPTLLNADEAAYIVRHSGARLPAVRRVVRRASAPRPPRPPASRRRTSPSLGAADLEPVRTHVARRGRGHRGDLLHQRHHRPAQGRAAHPPQPGAERDRQRLRRQPDPPRRRGDGLPAAVPHLRADGVDELHVPGRRDAAAAAAVRRRRRDRADAPRAGDAVLRRADDVRPAARRGAPGRRAAASCATASPAARRCRSWCWSGSRRPSAPRSTRATACPRPRRPPRSTSRGSAPGPAPSATRSGASRWRSPTRPSTTASSCCRPVGSARS